MVLRQVPVLRGGHGSGRRTQCRSDSPCTDASGPGKVTGALLGPPKEPKSSPVPSLISTPLQIPSLVFVFWPFKDFFFKIDFGFLAQTLKCLS